MARSGLAKRTRHIAALPDELMHIVFSKLDFHDKIYAGLACKQWDQLLKDGTAAARHWDIEYEVERIVAIPDDDKSNRMVPWDHPCSGVGRCAHSAYRTSVRRWGTPSFKCPICISLVVG
jgi:hypothetical protein